MIGKIKFPNFHNYYKITFRAINKRANKKIKDRDENIVETSTVSHLNAYGFGFAATGSLGVKEYIVPTKKLSGRESVSLPKRLSFFYKNGLTIRKISCGFGFTSFICEKDKRIFIYGTGLNTDGQLGIQRSGLGAELHDGQAIEVIPEPALIDLSPLNPDPDTFILKPSQSACGRAHMLILVDLIHRTDSSKNTFSLISTGNNIFGQGGRPIIPGELFSSEHAVMSRVEFSDKISGIKKIACGQDHSLVLTNDGLIYSCGLGTDGQTGLDTYSAIDKLTRIKGPLKNLKVSEISCKGDTNLALTDCNRLFCWGNNEYGQIWDFVDRMQVPLPIELKIDPDNIIIPPEAGFESKKLFKLGKIVSIAVAGSMCAIVDSFGQVYVWGFGNLGLGPKVEFAPRPTLIPPGLFYPAMMSYNNSLKQISHVTSGLHHFIAWSRDLGQAWAWGASRSGISCLGLGIGPEFRIQTSSQNTNHEAQSYPRQIPIYGRVLSVHCGVDHTFIIAKDSAFFLHYRYRSKIRIAGLDEDLQGYNPYKILGVSSNASQNEIRTAYFEKAKQTHPDKAKENTENQNVKFRLVVGAYAALSNPETRKAIDNAYGFTNNYQDFNQSLFTKPEKTGVHFERASEIFRKTSNLNRAQEFEHFRHFESRRRHRQDMSSDHLRYEDVILGRSSETIQKSFPQSCLTHTDKINFKRAWSPHNNNREYLDYLNVCLATFWCLLLSTFYFVELKKPRPK